MNDRDKHEKDKGNGPKDKDVTVTVRTPRGNSHTFTVAVKERVDKLIREAVAHFLSAGQLEESTYGIGLARDGDIVALNEAGRLDEYGVVDGDVLHLQNKKPQVDG